MLSPDDKKLVDRVQRLERCAWLSLTDFVKPLFDPLTNPEKLSYLEERIRTLAYLEAMPAK